MKRFCKVFISLGIVVGFCSAGVAHAKASKAIEGLYKSEAGLLDVIILDRETGEIAARSVTIVGACSGSVAGLGKAKDETISFSPAKDTQCVLNAKFSDHFNTVTVTASGDCSEYGGSGCGWEGITFTKRK